MPVDRPDRHIQLGGEGSLGYIRVLLDILEQRQFAGQISDDVFISD